MALYQIEFPIKDESLIKKLRIGDTVLIDGEIIGLRDATLIRIFDHHTEPPIELKGSACLHTAPGVKKVRGKFEKVSIGTTTSVRMERFTEPLMKDYGTKAIIGKGGLLKDSEEAMKKYCGCYMALTGGAAALQTKQIKKIEECYWEDLMPECLWKFRVERFGPLTVAMDCYGNNLYSGIKRRAKERLGTIFKILDIR